MSAGSCAGAGRSPPGADDIVAAAADQEIIRMQDGELFYIFSAVEHVQEPVASFGNAIDGESFIHAQGVDDVR